MMVMQHSVCWLWLISNPVWSESPSPPHNTPRQTSDQSYNLPDDLDDHDDDDDDDDLEEEEEDLKELIILFYNHGDGMVIIRIKCQMFWCSDNLIWPDNLNITSNHHSSLSDQQMIIFSFLTSDLDLHLNISSAANCLLPVAPSS